MIKAKRKIVVLPSLASIACAALVLLQPSAAWAQGLVPADFFNAPIDASSPAGVEASSLTFDSASGVITATGDVILKQDGYTVTGASLIYDRKANDARFQGAVTIQDPSGNLTETRDLVLTDGFKKTFVEALTVTSYDGARITADSADYDSAVRTLLTNATYAPCGDCVDAKGQRIGWSVRAKSFTYNAEDGSVYLDQPTLSLLGIPVAWLPFLWLPDTSESALAGVPRPVLGYSEELGATVAIPFKVYSSRWTDVLLTPTLMSRQGLMATAEWRQRFTNGSFTVRTSAVYQADPSAFEGTVGDRDWRGVLQTAGSFVPVQNWTVGWSYTAFTDAGFFEHYDFNTAEASINQVYATHLTADTFIDARVQEFNTLGDDKTEEDQKRQGAALPRVRFDHVEELGSGKGRVEISGRLLGVHRGSDNIEAINGVPYTYGYRGNKQHASFQAGWQTQWIAPGGFVATPYVGARTDFAYYNGDSMQDGTNGFQAAPDEQSLFTATPIAAMDVRYPLTATTGSVVHVVEPIGQVVYRGSETTAVGITNDDAQGFVLDDTNLFSFNRFSGGDRQETGLRANIGGRYQANFVDGSYLEVIAGQSFQLAGENAFAAADPANTGLSSGLDTDASYAVLGTYGVIGNYNFGGKLQVDPEDAEITRAGALVGWNYAGWSAGLDYHYLAANEPIGALRDQHEIGATLGVPLTEYWRATGGTYWDITGNTWLQVNAGIAYDDGYLAFGAEAQKNGPTHRDENDTRVLATFRLKSPAGLDFGYAGAVPGLSF